MRAHLSLGSVVDRAAVELQPTAVSGQDIPLDTVVAGVEAELNFATDARRDEIRRGVDVGAIVHRRMPRDLVAFTAIAYKNAVVDIVAGGVAFDCAVRRIPECDAIAVRMRLVVLQPAPVDVLDQDADAKRHDVRRKIPYHQFAKLHVIVLDYDAVNPGHGIPLAEYSFPAPRWKPVRRLKGACKGDRRIF